LLIENNILRITIRKPPCNLRAKAAKRSYFSLPIINKLLISYLSLPLLPLHTYVVWPNKLANPALVTNSLPYAFLFPHSYNPNPMLPII
jgi:hypothetical protein